MYHARASITPSRRPEAAATAADVDDVRDFFILFIYFKLLLLLLLVVVVVLLLGEAKATYVAASGTLKFSDSDEIIVV
jgi:hypothetical protein